MARGSCSAIGFQGFRLNHIARCRPAGAAYPAIMDATNKKAAEDATFATIVDAGLIRPGWKLWIPSADEAAAFMGTYKAYNEAPMLAEMVAAGTLPPVDERLPDNPLIENVVEEIGQYGGTWRRGFLGPADMNNHTRVVYNALVRYAPDGSEVIPHIAKGWESNDDRNGTSSDCARSRALDSTSSAAHIAEHTRQRKHTTEQTVNR